jgi:flagella basal body P-ring formation protein FlgA
MGSNRWQLSIVGLAMLWPAALFGAEIQLRSPCQPAERVVRLGDVAEVLADDSRTGEALADVELFPVPAAGEQRTLGVRQLQDTLALRGINCAEHRFTGASKVTIGASAAPARKSNTVAPASASMRRQAESVAKRAIAEYLQSVSPDLGDAEILVEVESDQARALAAGRHLRVTGGSEPWTGRQEFSILLENGQEQNEITIAAQLAEPRSVVVAAEALARGTILREQDVRLAPATGRNKQAGYTRLEDVLGKEVRRALSTGQAIDEQAVRAPILVRRGQVVSLYARTDGIQVRTIARARNDGGLGETIDVEGLKDRKLLAARVSGPQEAEVLGAGEERGQGSGVRSQGSVESVGVQALACPPRQPKGWTPTDGQEAVLAGGQRPPRAVRLAKAAAPISIESNEPEERRANTPLEVSQHDERRQSQSPITNELRSPTRADWKKVR